MRLVIIFNQYSRIEIIYICLIFRAIVFTLFLQLVTVDIVENVPFEVCHQSILGLSQPTMKCTMNYHISKQDKKFFEHDLRTYPRARHERQMELIIDKPIA